MEYTLLGPKERKQHSFDTCFKSVLQIIENKLNAPAEVRHKQIFAFSFFFDILKKAGIITSISAYSKNFKISNVSLEQFRISDDEGHPVEITFIKQKTETCKLAPFFKSHAKVLLL